jgi:hypothetical protein
MLKPVFIPVIRLVNVHNHVQKQLNQTTTQLDIDYSAEINRLRSTNASDQRAMEWQRCTQLGSFVTTDDNQNVWGSLLPLNYYVNRCTDVFGPEFNGKFFANIFYVTNSLVTFIARSIHKQRKFHLNTTNTIIVNGLIDPWSALSVQKSTTPIVLINLESTAHAAEVWPSRSQDPDELTNARKQILQTIKVSIIRRDNLH